MARGYGGGVIGLSINLGRRADGGGPQGGLAGLEVDGHRVDRPLMREASRTLAAVAAVSGRMAPDCVIAAKALGARRAGRR